VFHLEIGFGTRKDTGMSKVPRFSLQLAAGLVGLALIGGWATDARADIGYAYAEQTISGLAITPTAPLTLVGLVNTTTQDNTTQNGSGLSNSDPLNALEAYQPLSGYPGPGQDSYVRFATGNPPTSRVGNFTRADVVIASLAPGTNSSSVVSESFLNTTQSPAVSTETGGSGLTASLGFTLSSATALTLSYNWANDIFAFNTGGASATANFKFNITIKNATTGAVVFSSATSTTNVSLAAPPSGNEIGPITGTDTVTTPTLATGVTYSLVFSSTAQTSVQAAVPEPGSMSLVAAAGVLTLVVGAVRRRMSRGATV